MEKLERLFALFPELRTEDTGFNENLLEYLDSVTHLGREGLNLEFNNKGKYHGAIVMSRIFEHAKSDIKIFARNFKGDICDSLVYRNTLQEAIRRKVQVKIVFESIPKADSLCLQMVKELQREGENLEIKLLTDDFVTKSLRAKSNNNPLSNFTVSDRQMFRYETDKDSYKAFCNFDDKEMAAILDNNFNVLLNESRTI